MPSMPEFEKQRRRQGRKAARDGHRKIKVVLPGGDIGWCFNHELVGDNPRSVVTVRGEKQIRGPGRVMPRVQVKIVGPLYENTSEVTL